MTALVTKHLPLVAGARDGIKQLRALILELAVRGKLVAQDASDTTADSLLADIRVRLQEKSNSARTRRSLIRASVGVDEWPFILPSSWRWARFSEITSYVQRGKGPIYADRSQYPVISQKCVRWTGLDLSQARHIEPSSIDRYEEVRHLVKGDILWNSTGTGTIGRACVVKTTAPEQVLVADSHVTVVRCEGVVPEYLWRWIQTPTVQDQIENSASGSTNQVELNTGTVLAHLAPIPPLAEQHRIVAKVDELMALCDRLEADQVDAEAAHAQLVQALLDSLTQATDAADFRASWQRLSEHFHTLFTTEASIDALKQTVLQLAVMGKLVKQDSHNEPTNVLPKKSTSAKASLRGLAEQFHIPSSWGWFRLADVVSIKHGYAFSSSYFTESIGPFVLTTPGNFFEAGGFKDRGSRTKYFDGPVSHEFVLQPGDLIVAMTEQAAGLLGSAAFVPNDGKKYLHNQRLGKLFFDRELLLPRYLFHFFNCSFLRASVADSSTGMKVKHTSPEKIGRTPIPLPPLPEQHRIVTKVDELMALCDQLKAQLGEARDQHAQLATALVEQAVA